ncbi:Glycine reductase complex selenoprotein A [Alteribacillus bidgolensis]|uniref:Glycine reductase complex selenoprotein A n=3 Tax=Alteribacillus bidgolensis TaxID=930129 RepID=A0A1G8K3I3_9BACI|nr:Glycine reductase complex selenoprotein A [Alteribacillus bidgolensis]
MDQVVQEEVKKATEKYGSENVYVILGSPDEDSAEIFAETVTAGDPTYAGPLAGVALGLPVYHILEDEIKELIPEDVYQDQIGLMELSLNKDEIIDAMKSARASQIV